MLKILKLFSLALGLIGGAHSASALTYRTSCRIEGDRAVGYVQLIAPSSSTSFSGSATFEEFDGRGRTLGQTRATVIGVLVGHEADDVGNIDADSDAVTCSFDITAIVGPSDDDDGNDGGGIEHRTFCDIRVGRAFGEMQLTGRTTSTSFSGPVYFHFYDRFGARISTVPVTAIVTVIGRDREPVEDIGAPGRAVTCDLDINDAIN